MMVLRIIKTGRENRPTRLVALDRGGSAAAASDYRVEHRSGGRTTMIARTSDVYARQEELSRYAAQLLAEAATGELVLVDEATGTDVARRSLWPDRPTSSSPEHGDAGQHDSRGWLGGDAPSQPRWSPPPMPNQHRFADVEPRSATTNNCHRRDDLA